jgi:hypothetical protein
MCVTCVVCEQIATCDAHQSADTDAADENNVGRWYVRCVVARSHAVVSCNAIVCAWFGECQWQQWQCTCSYCCCTRVSVTSSVRAVCGSDVCTRARSEEKKAGGLFGSMRGLLSSKESPSKPDKSSGKPLASSTSLTRAIPVPATSASAGAGGSANLLDFDLLVPVVPGGGGSGKPAATAKSSSSVNDLDLL